MGNEIIEIKEMILCSILSVPCTETELYQRDFIKNKSNYITGRLVMMLETDGLIYYKGKSDTMHVSRKVLKEKKPHIYNQYF